MTELEKIEYTKSFIDKLANGINPLNDQSVPEGDLVNNVRLSRCFFYVSEILGRVIENGGFEDRKVKRVKKVDFSISDENMATLTPSSEPLSVSEVTSYINSQVDLETTKKLSVTAITSWLVKVGMLVEVTENDKKKKVPTQSGFDIGIITDTRNGMYGPYTAILYTHSAQRFIFDNLGAIVASRQADKQAEKTEATDFYNRPWKPEHDNLLRGMLAEQASVSTIAKALRRSKESVNSRIFELGL